MGARERRKFVDKIDRIVNYNIFVIEREEERKARIK